MGLWCASRQGRQRCRAYKKAAGHMNRRPCLGAGGVSCPLSTHCLCIAEIGRTARLRVAADSENLDSVVSSAAARGAGVRHQQAGRVQFQRVNARNTENMCGLALLPHNRRTTTSALHIKKFRVITLSNKGAAQRFGNGLERVVMHYSLPQAPAHFGRAYGRGCGASFEPYLP